MAQKESQGERVEKSSPFNLMPVELAAMGRKRVDEFLNAQTEFFDKLTETNRQWFDRVQSEAALSSELTSNWRLRVPSRKQWRHGKNGARAGLRRWRRMANISFPMPRSLRKQACVCCPTAGQLKVPAALNRQGIQ